MKRFGHVYYGLLGLPLAMASLPMYVQLPAYYTQQLGLPMAAVGYVLFFTRLFDTFQDPFIGVLINRYKASHPFSYIVGGVMLALAFSALWLPPQWIRVDQQLSLIWIGFMLFFAYTAHSLLNIAYLSWGAELGKETGAAANSATLLGAATWREGFGLLGVILASIAPAFLLVVTLEVQREKLTLYSGLFAISLALSIFILLKFASRPHEYRTNHSSLRSQIRHIIADKKIRPLFLAYLINSLAVALPASLMLFFVDQQIGANEKLPQFLVSYFVSGAIGLPIWLFCAKRFGSRIVWQASLLISILAFIGAAFLVRGDIALYTLICITSGLCLGADLVLPPVLLSEKLGTSTQHASYFGVWTFLGKIALATSSLSLPLLDFLQKNANFIGATKGLIDNLALVLCYALIPCALKILTFICLIDTHGRNTK